MVRFNQSLERRAKLAHDCGAFALACESGNPLEDVDFTPGHSGIVCKNYDIRHEEPLGFMTQPLLASGQIAFTADTLPTDPNFLKNPAGLHFIVRASAWHEQDPLYLSKLGPSGPVVLHTLAEICDFYPAQTVGQASNFEIVPASLPE